MKRLSLLGKGHRNALAAALFTAALFIGLAGCDLLSTSTSTGTLRLLLTDTPFPYDLVAEANVTVGRVDIVAGAVEGTATEDSSEADEGGITTLADTTQAFNLLELQDGVTALLSEAELEAGSYAQVRLIVSEASVVLEDETSYDLQVPSGAQTGVKVLLPGFEVEEDRVTELTLDFDVEKSFVVQGSPSGSQQIESAEDIEGFLFKPVVKPVDL